MKPGDLVVIAHSHVPPDAGPQEQDTLQQVREVAELLLQLGCEPGTFAVACDMEASLRRLVAETAPAVVVNLVESVGASCRGAWQAAAVLQACGVAYTGSDGPALLCSTNKLLAAQVLNRNSLPCPETLDLGQLGGCLERSGRLQGAWIVKSVWEHASLGLDAASVLHAPLLEDLLQAMASKRRQFGGQWHAERYIEGRECCLALLEFPGGVQVLPPAEMLFQGWEPGQPRILDFAAKWLEHEAVHEKTTRSFRFSPQDAPLLERLAQLALQCWDAFGLGGYARIDFRIDSQERPFVIDVNANPCLSADAGFAAALQQAGIAPRQGLSRILQAAQRRYVFAV